LLTYRDLIDSKWLNMEPTEFFY